MLRRTFLGGCAAVAASFAGCTAPGGSTRDEGGGSSDGGGSSYGGGTRDGGGVGGGESTGRPVASETTTPGGEDGSLDLQEANVVGVSVESADDGYRFAVTLHHDDDGEEGFANWWVVEARDGTELGRRELLHAHGTHPFTRSATVSVPEGTTCVVVRGHDEIHGYGGQAATVDLESGDVTFTDQGPKPRDGTELPCPGETTTGRAS